MSLSVPTPDTHDPQAPITPAVLFQHITGLRAENERLRELYDEQRELTEKLGVEVGRLRETVELFKGEIDLERRAARLMLESAQAFRHAATDLSTEVLALLAERRKLNERLDAFEARLPPLGNGHAG